MKTMFKTIAVAFALIGAQSASASTPTTCPAAGTTTEGTSSTSECVCQDGEIWLAFGGHASLQLTDLSSGNPLTCSANTATSTSPSSASAQQKNAFSTLMAFTDSVQSYVTHRTNSSILYSTRHMRAYENLAAELREQAANRLYLKSMPRSLIVEQLAHDKEYVDDALRGNPLPWYGYKRGPISTDGISKADLVLMRADLSDALADHYRAEKLKYEQELVIASPNATRERTLPGQGLDPLQLTGPLLRSRLTDGSVLSVNAAFTGYSGAGVSGDGRSITVNWAKPLNDKATFGIGLQLGTSDSDDGTTVLNSTSRMISANYSQRLDGGASVNGGLSLVRTSIDTSRAAGTITGSYDQSQTAVSLGYTGKQFKAQDLVMNFRGNLLHTTLKNDAYTESDATAYAASSSSSGIVAMYLDGRTNFVNEDYNYYGSLGLVNGISGDDVDRSIPIKLGVSGSKNGWNYDFAATKTFGENIDSHTLSFTLGYQF